jgi:hypothetical protein
MRTRRLVPALAVLLLLLLAAPPAGVRAQDGFMFGQPKAQVTLRAGPVLHRAGGDLFGFFTSELTLERGDFRAPAVGAELAFVLHPRIDVALGVTWSQVEKGSASFDSSCSGSVDECTYVDDQTLEPVRQTTSLRVMPVTATVRFYPFSRGRGISELAWVPARTTPYLGAGGGMAWYRLEQQGDFVDSVDLSIFEATFESSGSAPVGHLLAGVDHWFTPRVGLNAEGRYTFGSGRPGEDFQDWNNVDLSGLQFGLGLAFRW